MSASSTKMPPPIDSILRILLRTASLSFTGPSAEISWGDVSTAKQPNSSIGPSRSSTCAAPRFRGPSSPCRPRDRHRHAARAVGRDDDRQRQLAVLLPEFHRHRQDRFQRRLVVAAGRRRTAAPESPSGRIRWPEPNSPASPCSAYRSSRPGRSPELPPSTPTAIRASKSNCSGGIARTLQPARLQERRQPRRRGRREVQDRPRPGDADERAGGVVLQHRVVRGRSSRRDVDGVALAPGSPARSRNVRRFSPAVMRASCSRSSRPRASLRNSPRLRPARTHAVMMNPSPGATAGAASTRAMAKSPADGRLLWR